jgi:hypothetical protein
MRTLYGWLALAYSDAHVIYAAPATYMVPSVVPGTMGQQLVTGRVRRCINYRDGSICHHTTYESEPEPLWAVVIVASVTLGWRCQSPATDHQLPPAPCRLCCACLRTAKNAWAEPGRTCLVCRSLESRLVECIGRGRGPARLDLLPAFRTTWHFSRVTFLPLPLGTWESTPSDRRGARRIVISWSHSNSMRSAIAPSHNEDKRMAHRCHV